VMDGPVNGLDYGNQIRLLGRIAELSDCGYTFIKTTHFPDHALWVSDRVVMLKEGRIVADGPTTETVNKANLYQLYHTHVDVVGLDGGGRICVPHELGRYVNDRRPSGKHYGHRQRVRVAG
jgi:iron complex transport system ATP-binding protein